MTPHEGLPTQLRAVEDRLAGRPPGRAPARLRPRVVTAMDAMLRDEPKIGFWRFTAAAAAVAIVGMNLSMSAANATHYRGRSATDAQAVRATATQIRDLLPGLSKSQARRQAILLHAAGGIVLAPIPSRGILSRDHYLDFQETGHGTRAVVD